MIRDSNLFKIYFKIFFKYFLFIERSDATSDAKGKSSSWLQGITPLLRQMAEPDMAEQLH